MTVTSNAHILLRVWVTILLSFSSYVFAADDQDDLLSILAQTDTGVTSYSANSIAATTYIIGGDDADSTYPWMIALYNNGGFTCGGVLISSRWIATAAHCVYEDDDADGNATAYDASYFNVVIGESAHYSTRVAAEFAGLDVYAISNVVIHSDYDSSTYDYDIALLELDSSYYQPGPAIAGSARFDSLADGDYLTVIGYGYTSSEQSEDDIPETLQVAELPFISTSECYWDDEGLLTDNMFCAGYDSSDSDIDIDSCSGDSGGPVFTTLDGELSLVGLVSWGASDCTGVPGVYTKVSNLRSWILANIDGFQVVEQGSARYNSDTSEFTDGLLSVYHYGTNTDTESDLTIGSLIFNDDYVDTIGIDSDYCSNGSLSSTTGSCAIAFSLNGVISSDSTFTADLAVTPSTSAGLQTYSLNFVADLTSNDELTYSSDSTDDSDDSDDLGDSDDSNDSSSSSGGSLGFISLLLLGLLSAARMRFPLSVFPRNTPSKSCEPKRVNLGGDVEWWITKSSLPW